MYLDGYNFEGQMQDYFLGLFPVDTGENRTWLSHLVKNQQLSNGIVDINIVNLSEGVGYRERHEFTLCHEFV